MKYFDDSLQIWHVFLSSPDGILNFVLKEIRGSAQFLVGSEEKLENRV